MIRGPWGTSAAVLALLAAAGCGRRGPPLEPFVFIPDAVGQIGARRAGDEVYVTLTVPAQNIDGSLPIAIDRIEVYGYTGVTPPPQARWVELGTRVATVPVVVPEPDVAAVPTPRVGQTGPARPTEAVVVRDILSPDQLVQGPIVDLAPVRPAPAVRAERAAVGAPRVLQRFYTAFAFDPRGRPGPPGAVAQFAVEEPPPAPPIVRATYTASTLELAWTPSGGLLGYLLDRGRPPELSPRGVRPLPSAPGAAAAMPAPTRYNVYLAPAAQTTAPARPAGPGDPAGGGSWRAVVPAPLNTASVAEPAFSEPVQFGVERCYVVRAARGTGAEAVESAPSAQLCLTPEDVFPPAAPTGLAAVPTAGRVDLIWTPNTEADLGGYMILRGGAGEAVLQPLTETPVREARFLDDNVATGVRYQYAVIAVDMRQPAPNRSIESERVEATAR